VGSLQTRYAGVQVPEELKPLPKESYLPENIERWGAQDVCRWLKENGLEELARPFLWHEIDGSCLVQWRKMRPDDLAYLRELYAIEKDSLFLRFCKALHQLSPENLCGTWETRHVLEWLERAKLKSVAKVAEKNQWDGQVLHGLYEVLLSPSFLHCCSEMGVKKSLDQVRLASFLRQLFS